MWRLVLPTIPLPPRETVVSWVANYEDRDIELAIIKQKNYLSSLSPGEVHQKVTDFLRNKKAWLEECRRRAAKERLIQAERQVVEVRVETAVTEGAAQ